MGYSLKRKSICSICRQICDSELKVSKNKVFLYKYCRFHKNKPVLVSSDADFFIQIDRLNRLTEKKEPKEYLLYLTKKCNMNCNICFTNANEEEYKELSIEYIRKRLKNIKNKQITLFGGEPTIRKDLIIIIKEINKSKNNPVLFTNGIRTADYDYLKQLNDAGTKQVMLSFDGFDEKISKKVRGDSIAEKRNKTLNNLRRLKMSTVLSILISKNNSKKDNIKTISDIFNYTEKNKNNNIKTLLLSSPVPLGKNNDKGYIDREELVNFTEKATDGLINFNDLELFNKLLYIANNYIDISTCSNRVILPIIRDEKRHINLSRYLKLKDAKENIDRYLILYKKSKENKNKNIYKIKYNIELFKILLKIDKINSVKIGLKFLKTIFNIIKGETPQLSVPEDIFIVSIGNICNHKTADFNQINLCRTGKISSDNPKNQTQCMHNILKEINKC